MELGRGQGIWGGALGPGKKLQVQGNGKPSGEEARGQRWGHPEYREGCRTGRGLGVPGSNTESIGRARGPGNRHRFRGQKRGHGAGASGG